MRHTNFLATFMILLLIAVGCGDNRSYNNPVDPINVKEPSTGTNETSSGEGGTPDGTSTNGTTQDGAPCLTENCTSTAAGLTLALNSVQFIGSDCSTDSISVIKNIAANRITVIYRANYQSEGIWQLYARNITVNADGTLALIGNGPTNLFPNQCIGNTTGVTGYSITGYTGSGTTSKKYSATEVTDATAFSVSMTCYSSALNQSNTFDTSTLSPSVATTVSFLTTDGAVGYFKVQNVYVKANGTTINPNGSANSYVIPGNWTTNGVNPLGAIQAILGNDASGGLYIRSKNGSTTYNKYLTSAGVLNDSNDDSYIYDLPLNTLATGGMFHSDFGMYAEAGPSSPNYIARFNNGSIISKGSDKFYYSDFHFLGMTANKLLALIHDESTYDNRGYFLEGYNFTSGEFSKLSANTNVYPSGIRELGLYQAKALFYGGDRRVYITGDYFQ